MDSQELEDLLVREFYSWRPYKLIIERIKTLYGIHRSVSWLKRQLRRLNLKRRSNSPESVGIIRNCIMLELRGHNRAIGYRSMWKLLRDKYKLTFQMTCSSVCHSSTPSTSRVRSNNITVLLYITKVYNLCLNTSYLLHKEGTSQSFSRKIVWMEVSASNHDPGVTLSYYLRSIIARGGCPSIIRMDKGTENTLIRSVQYALREDGQDSFSGTRSFRFGTSPANIRIESLWSQLRRHVTGWWIDLFKQLEIDGLYENGSSIDKMCLSVVFSPLVECALQEFVHYWNTHKIRKTRADCLGGIPDDLYQMPTYYGTSSYVQPLNETVIQLATRELAKQPPANTSTDFYQQCQRFLFQTYGLDIHQDITISNSKTTMVTSFLLRWLASDLAGERVE